MVEALLAKLKQGEGTHGYLLVGSADQAKATFETITRELAIHPADKIMVEADEILIAAARSVIARMILRPFASSHKVAFLVGKLWGEAAAALLKIVEEPPGDSLIFFHATHTDDIPVTLASRLEKIRLKQLSQFRADEFPNWQAVGVMSLREKFNLAREVSQRGATGEFINSLLVALRNRLVYDMATQTKVDECLKAKRQLNYNINERLLLETLLVKLSHGV